MFSIDPACANLIFGGERHVELLLVPRLRLGDAQHVVVECDGLLKQTLVVV